MRATRFAEIFVKVALLRIASPCVGPALGRTSGSTMAARVSRENSKKTQHDDAASPKKQIALRFFVRRLQRAEKMHFAPPKPGDELSDAVSKKLARQVRLCSKVPRAARPFNWKVR